LKPKKIKIYSIIEKILIISRNTTLDLSQVIQEVEKEKLALSGLIDDIGAVKIIARKYDLELS
jgi:hypothetical protein